MIAIAILLLLQVQDFPPPPPVLAPAANSGSSISGKLLDASTGLPIAEFVLRCLGGPPHNMRELQTMTGPNGDFRFDGLEPARWRVVAYPKDGYSLGSKTFEIREGISPAGVELRLGKSTRISGRILDPDGNPVPNASVGLWDTTFMEGVPGTNHSSRVRANEKGEYVFENVVPRTTFLAADPPLKKAEIRERSADDHKDEEKFLARPPVHQLVTTFYPGTVAVAGALPLKILPGQHLERFDLTLRREPTVCLLLSSAPDPRFSKIFFTLRDPEPSRQVSYAYGLVPVGQDFEVCGIGAGQYRLSMQSQGEEAKKVFAGHEQIVNVTGKTSIRVPAAVLQPPQRIERIVRVAGVSSADEEAKHHKQLAGIYVMIRPAYRSMWQGEKHEAPVNDKGEFAAAAAFADDYYVGFFNVPAGYYPVSATHNGSTELYGATPVYLSGGRIEVTMAADGPVVTGTVVDKNGEPVRGATVVLTKNGPLPVPFRGGLHRVTKSSAEDGSFTVRGFPPGEYRLDAYTGTAAGFLENPANLPAATKETKYLKLRPNDRVTERLAEPRVLAN